MTPASPYLYHYARAILLGASMATLAVNIAPGAYYDLIDWHPIDSALLDNLRLFYPGLTLATLVSGLLMPLFLLLIGKEVWEALIVERGGLRGPLAIAPLAMVLGGGIVAALVWQSLTAIIETAYEVRFATGWVMPFGGDVVLAFFFGRMIFGKGHPALQVLLFMCILDGITGLVLNGLAAPRGGTLRLLWLVLPFCAAGLGYAVLTRPLHAPKVTERDRAKAGRLWPWALLGLVSWVGVSASGLPPALGLLPLLPAMPHGAHSFGIFAAAEDLLSDPLNRATHVLRAPVAIVMFLFGLTHGALDFAGFGPTTWVVLGAFWVGKPLGVLAIAFALILFGNRLPGNLALRDMAYIAGLMGIGFTFPILGLETALPGGAMQEAARLGLGLTLLLGPALLLFARATPPTAAKGGKPARQ